MCLSIVVCFLISGFPIVYLFYCKLKLWKEKYLPAVFKNSKAVFFYYLSLLQSIVTIMTYSVNLLSFLLLLSSSIYFACIKIKNTLLSYSSTRTMNAPPLSPTALHPRIRHRTSRADHYIPVTTNLDLITEIYGKEECTLDRSKIGFLIGTGGAGSLGLMRALSVDFIERYHKQYCIGYVKRGSGENIELIKEGKLDIALTYEPHLEQELLINNIICDYRRVFMDYFVLIGPINDPLKLGLHLASIPGDESGVDNLGNIFQYLYQSIETHHDANFFTRYGTSATTLKEQSYFRVLGFDPLNYYRRWYIDRGLGLFPAQALTTVADIPNTYVLNDLSTWRSNPEVYDRLKIFAGDNMNSPNIKDYENPCSSIVLNKPNNIEALQFAEYLTSPAAIRIIDNFGIERHGVSYVKAAPLIYYNN